MLDLLLYLVEQVGVHNPLVPGRVGFLLQAVELRDRLVVLVQNLLDVVLHLLDLLLEVVGLVLLLVALHRLDLVHLSLEQGDHVG